MHPVEMTSTFYLLLSVHGLNEPLIFALKPVSCTLAVIDIEFQKTLYAVSSYLRKATSVMFNIVLMKVIEKFTTCMQKRKSTC